MFIYLNILVFAAAGQLATPAAPQLAVETQTVLSAAMAEQLAEDATVRMLDTAGDLRGTGVIVKAFEGGFDVLTAAHVVAASPRVRIGCLEPKIGDLARVLRIHENARLLGQDASVDLALVRVQSGIPPAGVVPLSDLVLLGSEQFLAAAWSVDWTNPKFSLIAINGLQRTEARRPQAARPVQFWTWGQPSKPGMSGGPLLNEVGDLIGIASGNSGGRAYFVDEREIAKFLEKHLSPSPPNPPNGRGGNR